MNKRIIRDRPRFPIGWSKLVDGYCGLSLIFFHSLKHEGVYLKAYDSVSQATQDIGDWMAFYNQDRRHASLNRMTPDQVYYDLPSGFPMAA